VIRDFARRRCVPLAKGAPALSAEAITANLRDFEGWALIDGAICKTFAFQDYNRTMAFVNAAAWIAHQQDHHPDMQVQYGSCRVAFSTHSIGGISDNDFICAARIEELFA
jgi:4a-hydroxytetrahydrobiopterin dehydratase